MNEGGGAPSIASLVSCTSSPPDRAPLLVRQCAPAVRAEATPLASGLESRVPRPLECPPVRNHFLQEDTKGQEL